MGVAFCRGSPHRGYHGSGHIRAELGLVRLRANSEGSWAKKVGIVLSIARRWLQTPGACSAVGKIREVFIKMGEG